MNKKIMAIGLSISLITTQASVLGSFMEGFQGSRLGQIGNFLDNGSAGMNFANVTSPDAGEGGYFGGSVEFRFDTSQMVYEPWLDFNPPSFKMGCNGFSLDGGFADMLGIQDITQQLGNATGALMYGLLIGLVNSVPSIEHVFSKIKEVISEVQATLRNACNFGKNWSKDKIANTGFGNTMASFQKGIDTLDSSLNDTIDEYRTKFKDAMSGAGSATGTTNNQTATDFAASYEGLFKVNGLTTILVPELLQESKLQDGRYGIETYVVQGATQTEVLYLLAVALFGEYDAIDSSLAQFLSEAGKMITEGMAKGTIKDQAQASKLNILADAAFQSERGENSSFTNASINRTRILPSKGGENLLNILLNGHKGTGKLTLEGVSVFLGMVKGLDGKRYYHMLLPYTKTGKNKELRWKGLIKESEEVIDCALTNIKNGQSAKGCSKNNIALIAPASLEMFNTIISLQAKATNNIDTKRNGLSSAYTSTVNALKKQLAMYNAYYYAKYFLTYIETTLTDGTGRISASDMQAKSLGAMKNQLNEYITKLEKTIEEQNKRVVELKDRYKQIDEVLQKSRSKQQGSVK